MDEYDFIALVDCSDAPIHRVGRKAALLGWAQAHGVLTPGGLVLPSDRFWAALEACGVGDRVRYLAEAGLKINPRHTRDLASTIRSAISKPALEMFAHRDAQSVFARLGAPRLVCRSSAAMEDGRRTAFPGIFSTVLDLTTPEDVASAIATCWRSVFSPNAIDYLLRLAAEPVDLSIAILCQPQVRAAWYGVYASRDPLTGVAEARADLTLLEPEAVTAGKRVSLEARHIAGRWTGPEQVDELARVLDHIHGTAQELTKKVNADLDLEFAVISNEVEPVILQFRPLSRIAARQITAAPVSNRDRMLGRSCSGGRFFGLAVPVAHEGSAEQGGQVALVDQLTTDSYDVVFTNGAIVMEQDASPLSHVAILCRELGVPLISGITNARANLTYQHVFVNGDLGTVEIAEAPEVNVVTQSNQDAATPIVNTLELLINALVEAVPGQDIAIAKERALMRYCRELGKICLIPTNLDPTESANLNEWVRLVLSDKFSIDTILADWNAACGEKVD